MSARTFPDRKGEIPVEEIVMTERAFRLMG